VIRCNFTLRNIDKFRNVVTRPGVRNGLGRSVGAAVAEVDKMERALTLLPDLPPIYAEWKRLVGASLKARRSSARQGA
jgi:CTP:molybdopterin cytidylyltransferase MocA